MMEELHDVQLTETLPPGGGGAADGVTCGAV